MSDPDPTSSTPPVIEHDPARAPTPVRRRGGTPLPLTLLLTAGLGGGLYWVWTHPQGAPAQNAPAANAAADPRPAIDAARAQITAAVQGQLQALSGRVDALEKADAQPAPAAQAPQAAAPSGVSQEAFADAAKKIDDLSGRVDALSAKQDLQASEIQKTREIAAQRAPDSAPAAPPPDTAASQVPALIAGQQAADMTSRRQAADMTSRRQAADMTSRRQAADITSGRQAADINSRLDREKAAENEALAQQKTATDQALNQQKSTLDALEQRLAKLEAASVPADAMKQQQDAVTQASAVVTALGARVEKLEQGSGQAVSQQQEAVKTAEQQQSEAKTQIAAIQTRVAKLEQGAGQAQGAAQNASRAIRIEAAQAALAAGQPLGPLPDAPPALARFASVAPPTEAGLRAAFPQVADAARAASQPDVSRRSFLDRALARVQQSVTVRRGDHVLVGDPAAGVLARAQDALNAGDIKHAADILGSLDGPAAAAAGNWVAQARSLVDARAALAAMARG